MCEFKMMILNLSDGEEMTNNSDYNNSSKNLSLCDHNSKNPWCGEFGAQQYIEVIYLTILTIIGTLGNLLVIFSIALEKKIHKNANIFIINLAVADFLMTGIFNPTIIINVISGGNGISDLACQIFGFLALVACPSSMWNLTFIAFNRYVAITHGNEVYGKWFSRRKNYVWVAVIWIWSFILGSPAFYGGTMIEYEYKAMVCAWSDHVSIFFTVFLMVTAVLIPLIATIFSYYKLFSYVRRVGVKSREVLLTSESLVHHEARRQFLKREVILLKTLGTAVVAFVITWTPYCICIIFFAETAPPLFRKISTWLAVLNSALNFIIYGVMNQGYREGYRKLIQYLLSKRKNCNGMTLSVEKLRTKLNSEPKKQQRKPDDSPYEEPTQQKSIISLDCPV